MKYQKSKFINAIIYSLYLLVIYIVLSSHKTKLSFDEFIPFYFFNVFCFSFFITLLLMHFNVIKLIMASISFTVCILSLISLGESGTDALYATYLVIYFFLLIISFIIISIFNCFLFKNTSKAIIFGSSFFCINLSFLIVYCITYNHYISHALHNIRLSNFNLVSLTYFMSFVMVTGIIKIVKMMENHTSSAVAVDNG